MAIGNLLTYLCYFIACYTESFSKKTKIMQSCRSAVAIDKDNSSFLVDFLSNMLTMRLFEKSRFFYDKMLNKERAGLNANMKKSYFLNGVADGTWAFIKISEFFLIYGLGAYFIYRGATTTGVLIAFTFAIDIVMR